MKDAGGESNAGKMKGLLERQLARRRERQATRGSGEDACKRDAMWRKVKELGDLQTGRADGDGEGLTSERMPAGHG